jgi:hypothetical protein
MNYPITIHPGATFRLDVGWEDEDGNAIDLTAYVGRAQVRARAGADQVALEFAVSIDPSPGEGELPIKVQATDEETSEVSLPANRGVWDLELVSSGGEVTRLLYGDVKVIPEVTR